MTWEGKERERETPCSAHRGFCCMNSDEVPAATDFPSSPPQSSRSPCGTHISPCLTDPFALFWSITTVPIIIIIVINVKVHFTCVSKKRGRREYFDRQEREWESLPPILDSCLCVEQRRCFTFQYTTSASSSAYYGWDNGMGREGGWQLSCVYQPREKGRETNKKREVREKSEVRMDAWSACKWTTSSCGLTCGWSLNHFQTQTRTWKTVVTRETSEERH